MASNNKFKILSENSTAPLLLIVFFISLLFIAIQFVEGLSTTIEKIIFDNNIFNLVVAVAVMAPVIFLFSVRKLVALKKQIEINEKTKEDVKKIRYDILEAMDTLPDMLFCLIDKKKRIYWANKAMLKFDVELLGKPVSQIFFSEEELLGQPTIIHKASESSASESIVKYYPADSFFKSEKYIEHRCIPFFDAEKKVETFLLVSQDVTIRT